ncbi:hypothetical protein BKA63DRAFT_572071 [Paraphoma chrysanthemicola]|nr:hypothetical protein BKA63DRAFT_572071 [Paraphoma chrysanthemicola]
MGTLTADCPRLDDHCPHKLATSCRLTSTLNCCACADERAHSRTYRCYIDGVGFVQRGTRWQGYCWFCKEFWTNRLAATEPPLTTSQTRIPVIPDQTEFLERWFEFHQGYRIAKRQDGTEQRMPVMGEPLKEVSPGFLPRTLDQLRAGVENDARRPENRLRRRRLSSEDESPEEPQQSLESALDDLLAEASDDDTPRPSEETEPIVEAPASELEPVPAPVAPPRRLNGGEARLQRARERFARVFGTREDIQRDDYESPLSTMFNRANARYRQAEERRATDDVFSPSRETLDRLSVQERREVEEQLLWGVMRESATHHELESEGDVWSYAPRQSQNGVRSMTENPDSPHSTVNVTGTALDEMAQTGLFWETPIVPTTTAGPSQPLTSTAPADTHAGGDRALRESIQEYARLASTEPSRFRSREDLALREQIREYERLTRRARILESATQATRRREETSSEQADPRPSSSFGPSSSTTTPGMTQIQSSIQQITSELQRLRLASEAITSARHSMTARGFVPPREPPVAHTLDNQPNRPPPMTDEEMTKTLACQVCYQQLADTAVLPCGHMVMCQWCADVVIPVKHSHLPIRPSKCPMCRKAVKQRFRIHMGS